VSAFPVTLEGSSISALVAGGGAVALRRVRSLVEAGARVHVVAPSIDPQIEALATTNSRVTITRAEYEPAQLGERDVNFVVAATNRPDINAGVAADARAKGLAVNVAHAPDLGTCTIPAVHRAGEGDLVIAISAGGVPSAAARIRDEIARIIDERHGRAVAALVELRRTLLDRGERGRWREASEQLVGPSFLADVGSGRFSERLGEWR
jgi:precorrin-2 dehydrogenase/sirohydrochlorin ferrochelatase